MKVYAGPYPDTEEQREIQIEIHPYDVWNMDHTLALIIHPMLQELKKDKQGAPVVEDEDVPEELRESNAEPHDPCDIDEFWFDRWDWVLDEMIFAFEMILDDKAYLHSKEVNERIDNGLKLFGKYFRGLWT